MIRPPARMIIAVDPDKRWSTAIKAENERQKILAEIANVVRAQGFELDPTELDRLVTVHRWDESCFEFEHFDDVELARAISLCRSDRGGLSEADLVKLVTRVRGLRKDIKEVWSRWTPRLSKMQLAEALWPTLETKPRHSTLEDEPTAGRVLGNAFTEAMYDSRIRYVLSARPINKSPEART